ncbi:MAG: efflux RND transporter periplasmic adaptor subunit [Acidobacteria bacterium]|nr:efflux RND transporter periplasmic adaptor subunit [Acidobacteriota bacterium]
MTRKTKMIGAIAAGAAVLAAGFALALAGGDEPPIPTVVVKRAPYVREVTAEGNLKAVKATPVSAPREAQMPMRIAWLAEDGAPVRAGEAIVRFDPGDFERDLLEGQQERSNAGNRITGTEADAGAVRTNLGRDATMADRELEAARQFDMRDAEIFSRYEVIESDIDESLAVEKKAFAEEMQFVRDQLFRAEREILGIDERKADLRIGRAEQALSALEVAAPHDGILVLQRNWRGEMPRVGDMAFAGHPLGEIPDLAAMQVEAYVLEADAGGIATGQEATIIVESYPGRPFKGKVEKVEPIAKPRFRGSPVQYFGVTLALDETDAKIMKPGARVRATITLEKSESAIALPRQAIFDLDGKKVVYRRSREGEFEPVRIETGTSTVGSISITKGLAEGDVIALEEPRENGSSKGRT